MSEETETDVEGLIERLAAVGRGEVFRITAEDARAAASTLSRLSQQVKALEGERDYLLRRWKAAEELACAALHATTDEGGDPLKGWNPDADPEDLREYAYDFRATVEPGRRFETRAEATERILAEYRKSLDLTEEALRAAERERDELARKVFVPGLHRCAKCDLRLITTNFHVSDGSMSANREPQDCPNGCGPMWPVTEREAGNKLIDDMDSMVDRLKAAELQLSKAEAERDEWFGVWPKWAEEIRTRLRSYGVETDDDEGCDLPQALFDWIDGFEQDSEVRAIKAEAQMKGMREALITARNGLAAASVIGLFVPDDKGGKGRQAAVNAGRHAIDAVLQPQEGKE